MKRFKKAYLEITNICNLSCNFCPKTARKEKMMVEEEFINIINQIKPYTDYVYFHVMGEPLLNDKFDKYINLAGEQGLVVNLTTNGTLLLLNVDRLISAKGLRQINISLSSYESNKQTSSLTYYIGNIIDAVNKINKHSSIIVSIRLWNMDSDESKGENILNEDIFKQLETGFSFDDKITEQLAHKRSLKLKDRIYLNMAEKFSWPDININEMGNKVFCYGLRDQIGILVDGTVVPCCLDSEGTISLGNIFETKLEDILNSDRAMKIYKGFSDRIAVEDLCRKCGYAKRF
jgi:radical SAM protein with 4Fe4S-binding SPASM domain